jgi:preprotein translocase subunit YajC
MGGLMQLLPIILMFVVLWFLMIRPQMKKAKEHKALVAGLAKGDEVVTGGGICRPHNQGWRASSLSKSLPASKSVQKQAVPLVLPKGTLKSL